MLGMDSSDLMLRSSEKHLDDSSSELFDWADEIKPGAALIDVPIVYVDAAADVVKADDATPTGSTASHSRRRRRADVTPLSAALTSFELSFGTAEMDPHPFDYHHHHHYQEPQPSHQVAAFLHALPLVIHADYNSFSCLLRGLDHQGYDSVLALAFVSDGELAALGVHHPQDRQTIRTAAVHEFGVRPPVGPPGLKESEHLVTMSRWLGLCGIPPPRVPHYTKELETRGYWKVQHLELISNDSEALEIFRSGHYHLFKYHLDRKLDELRQLSVAAAAAASSASYASYYEPPLRSASDDFSSTLYDPMPLPSPASRGGFLTSAAASEALSLDTTFTHLVVDDDVDDVDGGVGVHEEEADAGRVLSESEMRLLYEAVNLDEKTNPCRRGKKVDWKVIASNGMGDPKFSLLASYSARELETNYTRQYELPLHANARTSEWTPELVKLLWKVSQDSRCKNGAKTMWEQIAQGKTGVDEYAPLMSFSNSQLRSRYRTEFGDKRPQSRRQARESKNAKARAEAAAAAQALGGVSVSDSDPMLRAKTTSAVQSKNAAKHKAIAAKAKKENQDANRAGLLAV